MFCPRSITIMGGRSYTQAQNPPAIHRDRGAEVGKVGGENVLFAVEGWIFTYYVSVDTGIYVPPHKFFNQHGREWWFYLWGLKAGRKRKNTLRPI